MPKFRCRMKDGRATRAARRFCMGPWQMSVRTHITGRARLCIECRCGGPCRPVCLSLRVATISAGPQRCMPPRPVSSRPTFEGVPRGCVESV